MHSGHLPGEAPPLSLSLALLVGVGEGLLSICRLTLLPHPPASLALDGSAEAPRVGVVEVLES